jgi:hypothetical protein
VTSIAAKLLTKDEAQRIIALRSPVLRLPPSYDAICFASRVIACSCRLWFINVVSSGSRARLAANFARLPELLRRKADPA